MIKTFESFAGIGTQRMALRNLGIEHEVVGISEIDKFALKSYMTIHGETKNFGDITKIKTEELPDFNLFTYSFPCQDISVAGEQKGLDENSNTRSSLLWECERIIKVKRPKYLLMENVKNLVGKRHKKNFDKWLEILEGYGYTNCWQVLNAKDYGIPQNRERVFCISILGEHEPYEFPEKQELQLRLKDTLETNVDEKYYLSKEQVERIKFSNLAQERKRIQEKDYPDTLLARDYKDPKYVKVNQIGQYDTTTRTNSSRFRVYDDWGISPSLTTMGGGNLEPHVIKNNDKVVLLPKEDFGRMGKQACETFNNHDLKDGDTINPFNKKPSSTDGISPTLTTRPEGFKTAINVVSDYRVRKLTPLECWRLMGISDEDFYKAQKVNSNSQLYKQAGNSIVVDVLEGIFKQLFNPSENNLKNQRTGDNEQLKQAEKDMKDVNNKTKEILNGLN